MIQVKRYNNKQSQVSTGSTPFKSKSNINSEPNALQQNFQTQLSASVNNQIKKELEQLLIDIDEKGKRFLDHPNVENLNEYKIAVRQFLIQATKKTYRVQSLYGNRMDYKVVETINNKIETLSFDMIRKEENKLLLIDRLDEIRGLLIDLLS